MWGNWKFSMWVVFYCFSLQDRSILNFDELIKKCDKLAENEILADNEREIGILEDLLTRVS
jgi:hypothetical protein